MSETVLAIETSQRGGGVALLAPDGTVLVEPLAAGARHDDLLVPAIDTIVRRAGLDRASLDVVGVSIGPGGFTGLRIAVTTAKVLAEALGMSIVPVPSALVAAESYTGEGPILVALASKRDTVWATRVVPGAAGWTIEGTPGLVAAAELPLDGLRAVVGDEYLPDAARARCAAAGVVIVEPVFDPAACLRQTSRLLEEGVTVDPLALAPLYPREPEAVTKWNARHGEPRDS